MINKTTFFNHIRASILFKGKLSQEQVNGINTIIDEFFKFGYSDLRWLAYILVTVYHETGQKMQPTKEFGGEKYLRSKVYYPYYGRDLTQTTWQANYEKVKRFSGIDVVSNPDLIGQMPLAAQVAIRFMVNGWYTGKKLSNYFNNTTTDAEGARKIINGTDKKELIADYYKIFYSALTA